MSPPRMAAHHGPSLPRISRGMRAGTAEDAGCVRGTSKAGCMRAACCPMPVQTGGQSWPNANRRLSKWVSKRLSKSWTGGGRRRRRNRGASPQLQLDRHFGHSWTGDAGWRRDWVHKRGGIGGRTVRDRCGIAVNPAAIPHFDPAPALRHLDYTQTGLCALKAHATVEWMSAVFIVLDTPAYPGEKRFGLPDCSPCFPQSSFHALNKSPAGFFRPPRIRGAGR